MTALRIGTRASALARWQAESVRAALAAAGIAAALVPIRTAGDRDRTTSLSRLGITSGGKGIFVKQLEDALLAGRVDLAVHSMKDVPTDLPDGLAIAAICRRHDVHDVLVSRNGAGLAHLPKGARVGTSSLRRQAQLRHFRRDLEIAEIRGNVDTRLGKVSSGEYDAAVLAKAGLDRLGLSDRITEVLSIEICLPAPGQGAIGIETRAADRAVLNAVRALDHAETRAAVEAERALLAGLGGGCLLPVGAWARIASEVERDRKASEVERDRKASEAERELILESCVLSPDGSESVRVKRSGPLRDPASVGREAAAALAERGAGRLLELAERSLAAKSERSRA